MPFLNAATSKLRNLYSCLSRWLEGYATATRADSVENSHCLQEFEVSDLERPTTLINLKCCLFHLLKNVHIHINCRNDT